MNPDRAETLIDGYLQGTLTEAEQAELDRALAEDPGLARLLMGAVADESLLREHFGGAERLRRLEGAAPSRRSAIRWAALAAAAMIAIALGILFLRSEPGVATIVRVEGTVHILGQGLAAVGAEVPRGAGVESAAASSVTLQFPDATRLDLGGNSRLSRVDPDRLRLERGSIAINAKHPLVLETPHGEAHVLGTQFRVSVADDSTRLDVTEGKVRLLRLDGKSVDVISGHYAVAATGVELVAKSVARRGAELVAKMPPKSWLAAPNTPLRSVVPDYARYPKIHAVAGPRAIMECWSGGALDTRRSRLFVWGGGSTPYHGNELYAFDVDSLSWARLTEPWPDPPDGAQTNPDGSPNARATYGGLAYIAHADRLFACGGETARSDRSKGSLADLTWTFDPASKRWSDRKPSGDLPPTYVGNTCAYDPETRKVWWGETASAGRPGLYSYDYDANRWTRHSSDDFYSQTSAIDTRRGLLIHVGRGEVFAYDLRRGNFTRQTWKTTGGDDFIVASAPGLDYDPVADRIVGWAGGAVYALDPDTKAWTKHAAPGAPVATPNGIFGRWRYVPSVKAFVVATNVDGDVHFFKFAP